MPRKSDIVPLKSVQIGELFLALTLDTRFPSVYRNEKVFPIAIRSYDGKKVSYFRVAEKFSREAYIAITRSTGRGRISEDYLYKERPFDIKCRLISMFDSYASRFEDYNSHIPLTSDAIAQIISGKSKSSSFYDIWDEVIASRSLGTSECYLSAKKSFQSAIGEINGFNIPQNAIKKWVNVMTVCDKSKTTIGIYLRACRVVWNVCQRKGFISSSFYPFSKNGGEQSVQIPRGHTRKNNYLDTTQMSQLFKMFIDEDYPKVKRWGPQYTRKMHLSLGLFLVQYLCNGFNLADAALLEYNQTYFSSGGKELQFIRKKTKDRNEESSEVLIPITDDLQKIMNKIASEPRLGERVFPFIIGSASSESEIRSQIKAWNSNIQDRLRKLTAEMGWLVSPSGTWARHSFATNLTHAGVPHDYISESMGHSVVSKDITSLYIAKYPLKKQMEYNARLLRNESANDLLEIFDKMTAEEKSLFAAKLLDGIS